MKKPFIQASPEPCLHCGAKDNQLFCHGKARTDGTPVDLLFHVSCNHCRASGPVAKTAAEALKAWAHLAAARVEEKPPALLPDVEFEGEEEGPDRPEGGAILPH